MAQRLPSEEQIIAILRDEPMVGSQLRGALGLPKKQKMAFKQMLADMVERGLLKRTSHKEYQLGDGESLEHKPQGIPARRRREPRGKAREAIQEDCGTGRRRQPQARRPQPQAKRQGKRDTRKARHTAPDWRRTVGSARTRDRQGVRDVPPQAGAGQGRRDHQLYAVPAPETQAQLPREGGPQRRGDEHFVGRGQDEVHGREQPAQGLLARHQEVRGRHQGTGPEGFQGPCRLPQA